MRNLKKLLALVLAMAMAFSLMLSASATDYEDYGDKDQITEEFKEAVQVLTGLEVFQGDEKGFRPGDTITRAEVATIIYRIATGDVAGKQVKIYADYSNFTDVNKDDWFAGAVGYCQNAGYIKGTSPTTFRPYGQVTGYEALAMILRVVGYDKNHEFEGATWQVNVASLSKELGVTDNVKNADFETTLNMAARRDVVADLLFQTAVLVPTVTYTPALAYSDKTSLTSQYKNTTLGQKTFGLFCEGEWKAVDKWGTPGYYWVKDGEQATKTNADGTVTLLYDTDYMPVFDGELGTKNANVVATITPKASVEYYTADVHECDVAHDLDFDGSQSFKLYVNRNTPITDSYKVVATDTVTRVGGQGRETKFWRNVTSPWTTPTTMPNWCTMVDTYLATVTNVTERVLDPAGHVIVPAYLYLDVYDGQAQGQSDKTDAYRAGVAPDTITRNTSEHRASKSTANWEYVKGDKVLIKGYTDYTQNYDGWGHSWYTADTTDPNNDPLVVTNDTGLNHLSSQAEKEQAAFETNILQAAGSNFANDDKINVVQKAEPVLGKQTVTYWNQAKHTVDGKDYNDQMTLFLDVAGTKTGTTYAWYFDTRGNLIGIDYVPNTVNYGVITSIYSSFGQGEASTDGTAKAIANVLYADGTTATVTIDRFLMTNDGTTPGHGDVDTKMTDTGENHTVEETNLTTSAGIAELLPVYDNTSSAIMTASARGDGNTKVDNANYAGWLHVAPVINLNAVENGSNTGGYYGVLRGNLFKFVSSADGDMTAIEVAGHKADPSSENHADDENSGVFEWHYNNDIDASKEGKLYKGYSYLTLDNGDSDRTGNIWLDADTRIMVRGWDVATTTPTNTVNCYTLATLPGDVSIPEGTEVDWADPDNDGRADYVYLTGRIEGNITYGLFYYNGGAAQWNGADKTGTMFGWLNGEATTISFNREADFNLVKNSQAYKGHLFALELTNNVVSNVMEAKNEASGNKGVYVLADYTVANDAAFNTDVVLKFDTAPGTEDGKADNITLTGGTDQFLLGTSNGNPYRTFTEAVYYDDVETASNTTTVVSYDVYSKTVTVWKDTSSDGVRDSNELTTYYLNPGTKVIGLGMSVTQDTAILDYLNHSSHNDVTIVYENSLSTAGVYSVVEIYVATDPNSTPSGETAVATTRPGAGVQDMSAITSEPSLLGALKAAGPNQVIYNSVTMADSRWVHSKAEEMLYFPFNAADDGKGATLSIYDSNGDYVYYETADDSDASGWTAGEGHFFGVNFTKRPTGSTADIHEPLATGTYTYRIVSTTGVLLSSGSFSITSK